MVMTLTRAVIISMQYPPHNIGGDATIAQYHAEGLAARGIETYAIFDDRIHFKISKENHRICNLKVERKEINNLHLCSIPPTFPPSLSLLSGYALGNNLDASLYLKSLIIKKSPDLFHFHDYYLLGDKLLDMAYRTKRKIYITTNDFWLFCPNVAYIDEKKNLCENSIYENSFRCLQCCLKQRKFPLIRIIRARDYYLDRLTKIIVSCNFMKKLLIEKGFPDTLIEKVSLPLETNMFSHMDERKVKIFKENYKLGKKIVLLYAGSLHFKKGVHILIDAFKSINKRYPNVVLMIAGDGKDRDSLVRRADGNQRIIFLGKLPKDKLLLSYMACDIFVMPSIYPEFFSISAHEAMLVKKPVVTTDVGALPEFVIPMKNGLLVKPGDVKSLADALIHLINDQELRNRMGGEGNRMASRFTIENHINALLKVYRQDVDVTV